MLSWGSATTLFSRYVPEIMVYKKSYGQRLAENPHLADPQGVDYFFR